MPPSYAPEPLAYRPIDAARAIGCSRSAIYELLSEGRITARKLGTRTLIPRSELERLLEELPTHEAGVDAATA